MNGAEPRNPLWYLHIDKLNFYWFNWTSVISDNEENLWTKTSEFELLFFVFYLNHVLANHQ